MDLGLKGRKVIINHGACGLGLAALKLFSPRAATSLSSGATLRRLPPRETRFHRAAPRSSARPSTWPPTNAHLPGRIYVCGDCFTLADILLFCFVNFGAQVGQPANPNLANLAAWSYRVAARSAAA
ncbi:glutathione binding-like protein [Sphingomonas sp.]|uniref:glutathione binding-like protein n=1 Tax=Sphingomonas sp. TaxID=28214 RepID=UPI0037527924